VILAGCDSSHRNDQAIQFESMLLQKYPVDFYLPNVELSFLHLSIVLYCLACFELFLSGETG